MGAADTYATPSPPAGTTAPLVNRERELVELDAALGDARTRHGRVVLIAGEPGIGKTRLAEETASRGVARHMLPLWGRAWETAGAPAYWPWVQLLRGLIETRDDATLEAEVGAGASWLAQVIPELPNRLPGVKPPRAQGSEKARFAVFDAVASFLRRASAADPLVIVLDDLHAADPGSLLLFEFVARSVGDARVLLLGTYQQAAARRRPDVERLIGALGREGPTLVLRGFGEEELGRIVENRTGEKWSPEALRDLHETTEGNPFFTNEVVGLVAAEGDAATIEGRGGVRFPLPDTVRDAVRRRFEPLGASTTAVLEAATVIGREFKVATLEKATGSKAVIAAVDEALAAGLVTAMPGSIGQFRFSHNLIRETLYAGLPTARRMESHSAVAEALEASHGEAREHFAERAHHYAEAAPAGYAEKALEYAEKAAREAMRLFAYEQAAELYQLALDVGELLAPDPEHRAEILLAKGKALRRADHFAATDTLIAAADAARGLEDPKLFAEAALAMRAFPRGMGVISDEPSALLSEALERLGDGDVALRARVMARLGVAAYYMPGTEARRLALAEEAIELARGLDDDTTLAHVLSNGQLATWAPHNAERDLAWMRELLSLTARSGDDELELAGRNRLLDLLIELDDVPAADAVLGELEHSVTDSSDPRVPAYVLLHRARQAVIAGRLEDAESLNARAAAEGVRLREPILIGLARDQLSGLRWTQWRLAEAEGQARQSAGVHATPAWPAVVALIQCEVGREADARRQLERFAANGFRDLPRYNDYLITLSLLSEISVRLGDHRRAGELYELLSPFNGRNVITVQAAFVGPVAHFLGILATGREEWELAETHFAEARESAARLGAPAVLMRTAFAQADMLGRRARPEDRERELELLAEAGALAVELGVENVVQRVEERRRALGSSGPVEASEPAAEREAESVAMLRREGDVWAFTFEQRSVRVRDGKGIRHLALLLSNPGAELHALELARADAASDAPVHDRAAAAEAALSATGEGDAGPALDAEAKAAYRRRLEELGEELAEAESFNDPERASHAREEMDFLAGELAGALGLGGRDRKAASNAERARVSVTKALRATIKRLGEHDAELGRELEATVRTGTFCAYEPDRRRPVEWRVDPG